MKTAFLKGHAPIVWYHVWVKGQSFTVNYQFTI